MARMEAAELRRLLLTAAGEPDDGAAPDDFADQDFEELGYDSLILIETAARIADQYGIQIPDELLFEMRRPGEILDIVNGSLAEPA